MAYWSDSLLIGVPEIDRQHRKLVQAIDELMEACSKGQGRAAIGKTLEFTVAYTKEHFADEERLQAKYAYPGMAAHKQLHAQFIRDISALADEFERTGPSLAMTGRINKVLVDWLIKHIRGEDKKLGDHIRSKDAK